MHQRKFVLYLVVALAAVKVLAADDSEEEEEEEFDWEEFTWGRVSKDVREDSLLPVDKLISKYGYNSESHSVVTEDGYILTMHRIKKTGGKPILLQHGLVDSSAGYVIMGPNVSLAYLLSDLKYDVWLGNARGNRYSRNHTTLDPDSEQFWDFSWHEIGYYDLPAMINYVLNTTGYEKLHYAGHSQGCTSFFVMCSMRPEFNEKIALMQALAPAVYLSETRDHPYLRIVELYLKNPVIGPSHGVFGGEYKFICRMGSETQGACIEAIFSVIGRNSNEFNRRMFPVVLGHYPAGASAKQIKHFLQIIKSGRFAEYNYGSSDNIFRYRNFAPPKYDLSRVTTPVYIYYSSNDLLVNPADVENLFNDLKNPIGKYLVPMRNFNHLDFLWAKNVRKLVYEQFVRDLKGFKEEQTVL